MRVGLTLLAAFLLALILGAGGHAPRPALHQSATGCGKTQVCPMDGRPMRDVLRFRTARP